jgi:hypothetical protein
LSTPAYVASESENLALVTVTGKAGFVDEQRNPPGGVQTVNVHLDRAVKGGAKGDLTLGQSVSLQPNGTYSTAGSSNRYDLLQAGRQYIVSFYAGGGYGEGYTLYSEVVSAPDAAVRAWTDHVAAKATPPPPTEC